MAGSANEGAEKQQHKEVAITANQQQLGEMSLPADMESMAAMPEQVTASVTAKAPATAVKAVVEIAHPQKQQKLQPFKLFKTHKEKATHNGGSIFGILSFVFGLLAFGFAWAVWPFGLAFAILAIIFGIVGLAGDYTGRTLALIGLILGVLTIILPVFIVAVLAAA